MIKPIRLWLTRTIAPSIKFLQFSNTTLKVIIILEELQIPYEIKSFKFDDVKKPYTGVNPNGRVPGSLSVLNTCLEGKQWLVGDKCTFADLCFVPWNDRVDVLLMLPEGQDKFEGFPNVRAWHERMTARPSWKKGMEIRARLMDEQGLTWNGMPKGINNIAGYEEKVKRGEEAKARREGA
ncbi:glutathione S-transferase [Zopfia rhizophila CBS 207.26]|uniref:glutathione transferase n=1 Tax=Zopfia rhizophila CBS 207.26 TaxID=1314779 RepID=A0A6A6E5W0_9PEZI|nr:glutathione S-transferase [Zopfia rhizophila CBS 207.26]